MVDYARCRVVVETDDKRPFVTIFTILGMHLWKIGLGEIRQMRNNIITYNFYVDYTAYSI